MFGSTEIIVIVVVVFVLFGAKSIPKFAKSLGEARKEFQDGLKDADSKSADSSKQDSDNKAS